MVDVACDAAAAGSVVICGGNSFYEGSAIDFFRLFFTLANGRPLVGDALLQRRGGEERLHETCNSIRDPFFYL